MDGMDAMDGMDKVAAPTPSILPNFRTFAY